MRGVLIAALLSVVCAASPADARSLSRKGIVTAIDFAARRFNCHWQTRDWVYQTSEKTVFRFGRTPGTFSDLKIGARVTVNYHLFGKDSVADRVAVAADAKKTPR